MFGKVPILHLDDYHNLDNNLNEPCDTLIDSTCHMERFYLRDSSISVDLLDRVALSCYRLQTLHLENILPTSIPQPSNEAHMSRQFNVFTRRFVSDQLVIVNLINCRIISLLGLNLLENTTSIRMISLSRNHLTMLDNAQFFPTNAPYFWSLDLSYNKLRSISMEWVFPETLRVLKLDHNHFTVIPFDSFKSVWHNLDEFWIYGKLIVDSNFNYLSIYSSF